MVAVSWGPFHGVSLHGLSQADWGILTAGLQVPGHNIPTSKRADGNHVTFHDLASEVM